LVRIGISDTANGYVDYQYFYINKNAITPAVVTNVNNTLEVKKELKIYPNPCTENVYIELSDADQLTITDVTGKTIENYSSPSDIVSMNTKDFESGVYFAHVRSKTGSYSAKFLKK